MKTYRVVNVYTGYGENSIESVKTINHHGDVTFAAKWVENTNQQRLRDESADNESYIQEFFTGVQVVGDIAGVSNGEENVLLVIPATSVWFERVMNEDSVYDNHINEWNDVIFGRETTTV